MLNAPHSAVIRNGEMHRVDSELLVKDDVIFLEAGNQIPADARIIKGKVTVNESLLTGESDEISKETEDSLMSG